MLSEPQTILNRFDAVEPESLFGIADDRCVIDRLFTWQKRTPLQIRDTYFQNILIPRRLHKMAKCNWNPQVVIRTAGTNTVAMWRVPPVLHISLNKLP